MARRRSGRKSLTMSRRKSPTASSKMSQRMPPAASLPSRCERARRTPAVQSRFTVSTPPITTALLPPSKNSWQKLECASPFYCERICYEQHQRSPPELVLSQWTCADQRHRDLDRIVIGTRKELDCAQHRVMQAGAQIGDFRDPHCTSLKIRRTLIEDPFQN